MRFFLSIIGTLAAVVVTLPQYGCCDSGATSSDAGRPDGGRTRLDGGAGADAGIDDGSISGIRGPTQGSAVAVTRDGRIAIAINRRTGRAEGSTIERFMIDLGAGDMTAAGRVILPDAHQVIIGPDDNTAYAAGRTEVTRYEMIKTGDQLRPRPFRWMGGGEPRGIALSPNGTYLFVANWTDGTVLMFKTDDLSLFTTVNLNLAMRESQLLGNVPVRPGLAHPYAVAVTDDGDDDDDDETVFVTEYFSQNRTSGLPSDNSVFDLGRQGVVYYFDVASQTARLTTLAPRILPFMDSAGNITGCFPNLLNVATYHANRIYVAGNCSSPRGPLEPTINATTGEIANAANIKTLMHSAIWVINPVDKTEAMSEGLVLSAELQRLYDQQNIPDDDSRRMPLIISSMEFQPESNVAWLSAYGSDALFRVEWSASKAFLRVGSDRQPYIDLGNEEEAGRLPFGMRLSGDGKIALVVNEHTRNVSFVDLEDEVLLGAANMSAATELLPSERAINDGRRNFVTGVGRWSWRGQAWSSCEGCHPNGLSDGVTWFFPRGPRQTIPLDGSYSGIAGVQRLFGWTAHLDEVHDFEQFGTRDISGGVGAVVHQLSEPPSLRDRIHFNGRIPSPPGTVTTTLAHHGLNGSGEGLMPGGAADRTSLLSDWNDIREYLTTVRTPFSPSNLDQQLVLQGRMVFQSANCAACHVTELWTNSRRFYTPNNENNHYLRGLLVTTDYTAQNGFPAGVNPPTAPAGRRARLRNNTVGLDDQINCVLRAVGTFPATPGPDRAGVSVPEVLVREVRPDMNTLAQGATGYNVPSLLGVAHSAPYFHAGNARTLEELLSQVFAGHHQVFAGSFMSNDATALAQLVAFLSSIDERTTVAPPPNPQVLGFNPMLCPVTLMGM